MISKKYHHPTAASGMISVEYGHIHFICFFVFFILSYEGTDIDRSHSISTNGDLKRVLLFNTPSDQDGYYSKNILMEAIYDLFW